MKTIATGVKFGIGFMIGKGIVGWLCDKWCEHLANDDEYMNRIRFSNPKLYQDLLKDRTKK